MLLFINKYPNARTALLNWYQEFIKASFENFNQLKSTYGNASIVSNERVIFNIKGNDYRLIISINFKRQAAYIIWFGTHSEYDKIDAATVKYTL
nr:type II toxin-antitoxin system HigB family toxin [uncultured Mucilaginibacter sp.]